jgi:FKBP-type peptidyl-prolyl cis-trans isomerase
MLNRLSRNIIATPKPFTHNLYRTFRSSAINMGVTKKVLTPGNGSDKAKAGDKVAMVYTGWLEDTSKPENKGEQFDSSVGRGDGTFPVNIGTGQVIKGEHFTVLSCNERLIEVYRLG